MEVVGQGFALQVAVVVAGAGVHQAELVGQLTKRIPLGPVISK